MSNPEIVRLRPYQYVHILNNNSNATRIMVGPTTYTRYDHEKVLGEPQSSVIVGPTQYAIVENPVVRDGNQQVVEKNGQAALRLGGREIRFHQAPFPLYPGEVLVGIEQLQVLTKLEANHVCALSTFEDKEADGKKRLAGDEWLVYGPCTFMPRVEVEVISTIEAQTVDQHQALKLRARFDFTDRNGVKRVSGSEWNHTKPGAFIPWIEEEVVEVLQTRVITDKVALHVSARVSFTDRFGKQRKAGSGWLVTSDMASEFLPTPEEEVVGEVPRTKVGTNEYAVVLNPVDAAGNPRLGTSELRRGKCQFFLHPGEELQDNRIKTAYILGDDEAVILFANDEVELDGQRRKAGDRWMIQGPRDFIPPTQVVVEKRRKAIPLDENEGVYIRDKQSGQIRAHVGSTVMLNEHEELWEKPLPALVEELLSQPRLTKHVKDPVVARQPRIKHKVVTCNIPHNSVIQIYDFRRQKARVVVGPEMVWLQPDEEFTVLSLSGGKPKQGDLIKTLSLHTGPDFMTDIIQVETSDHARLQLQLSYNWEFDQTRKDLQSVIFAVPDFVGDACKAIASRIRGAVAGESFDSFHRHSNTIIRLAVFGMDDATQKPHDRMVFDNNGLIITNVDIHSVDPMDPKTREALVKSVQLAIEITTKSQEATARHQATSLEYAAKGRLEQQVIGDKAESEKTRCVLLQLEADNNAIESSGASKASAKANAEAKMIEGETDVQLAEKRANIMTISTEAELTQLIAQREQEVAHKRALNKLETDRAKALAQIEADKFTKVINAIGKDTILALSKAGPELQARMLKSLGLQGYLVTDGTNPINLFNAAKGFTQQQAAN